MADNLYLSLWFPSFTPNEALPRLLSVLKQFPFSASHPGVSYAAVHPVSWNEATVFEETFDFSADPERVMALLGEFVADDNAYEVEALWDLSLPPEQEIEEGGLDAPWSVRPHPVTFVAHGLEFDDHAYQEAGHIRIDFGLDTPFLYEDYDLTPMAQSRVKQNIHKLVSFTNAIEKNCGISGRVLWSESDENLAQKLISRLQKVQ